MMGEGNISIGRYNFEGVTMRTIIFIIFATILNGQIQLRYNENITPTYNEAISWYKQLDMQYSKAKLIEYGKTDIGKPLHLFILSDDQDFCPKTNRYNGKCMILINNAIHPGEPCGVDASLEIAEKLLREDQIPKNVIIGIIPMYNIGGVLNRNSTSRANQNGPEEYGFRGNARNLDLNRDFIKLDSENAKSFTKLFHDWNPDFFIDTHTTNGADYQHIMTLISPNPLGFTPSLQNYVKDDLLPTLYSKMEKAKYPMVPYVSPIQATPESGLEGGVSPPRYSSGYASLFNTFGFISEAHMFKTYTERVEATVAFLDIVINYAKKNSKKIISIRELAQNELAQQKVFTLTWSLDSTRYDMVPFMGYEAKYKKSNVTGFDRLYYDRDSQWAKEIPLYNYFTPNIQVTKPDYYVVPQAWKEVIERLELNSINMIELDSDTVLIGEMYTIMEISNPQQPINGHSLHSNIELEKAHRSKLFYKGDMLIPMNQTGNKYIIQTLEPLAEDSFLRWNFFDSILDQREWFSPYVFEETAEQMLKIDIALKEEFEELKKTNSEFANNPRAQLYWLYQRSPNFESDISPVS